MVFAAQLIVGGEWRSSKYGRELGVALANKERNRTICRLDRRLQRGHFLNRE
jgi:hypothetical protein